ELLHLAVADQINAAVPDMPYGKEIVLHQHAHDGRTHAFVLARALFVGSAVDRFVGPVNSIAQGHSAVAHAVEPACRRRPVAIGVAEKIEHGIHTHLAGDFASGLSAHAIAHHVDPIAHVVAEVILVVGAHASQITFARDLDGHTHMFRRVTPHTHTAGSSQSPVLPTRLSNCVRIEGGCFAAGVGRILL